MYTASRRRSGRRAGRGVLARHVKSREKGGEIGERGR